FLRKWMCVAVAPGARATHLVRRELLLERSMLGNFVPVVERPRMTQTAVRIVVGLYEVNFLLRLLDGHLFLAAEVVEIDVPQSPGLGEHVAEHPVVRVA